jgi:hypothetical protein
MTDDQSALRAQLERATKRSEAALKETLQANECRAASMAEAMVPILSALSTLKDECAQDKDLYFKIDPPQLDLDKIRSAVARVNELSIWIEPGTMDYVLCINDKNNVRYASETEPIAVMVEYVGAWRSKSRALAEIRKGTDQQERLKRREERIKRGEERIKQREGLEKERQRESERQKRQAEQAPIIERATQEALREKIERELVEERETLRKVIERELVEERETLRKVIEREEAEEREALRKVIEREKAEERERELQALAAGLPAIKERLLPIFERGAVNARNRYGVELEFQVSETALTLSSRGSADNCVYSVRIFGSPAQITSEFRRECPDASVKTFKKVAHIEYFAKRWAAFVLGWLARAAREGATLPPTETSVRPRALFLGLATLLSIVPCYAVLSALNLWPSGVLMPAVFVAMGLFVYQQSVKRQRRKRDLTRE